ncbi:hypothetical protein RJT34_02685 [Clitoria ternatea]|uniref:Uncharacterized protein n=1 Tax=Clitoria ternatea TaxID=43366 RepID=A0AAN9KIV3_CLITE
MDEFDRVEQELVSRDADLKALVGPLKEEVRLQKLAMITIEKNLKEKAKESHESLLRKIKSKGLIDQNTVAELKIKNEALERENSELKALKRKWDVDTATFAEVRSRLEIEKVGNENALDKLKMKNTELAEVVKKNLETIEDLRAENNKLADKKRRFEELNETLETKFEELNERVLKLEVDTKVLMNVDDYASAGVDEHGITSAVNNTRSPTTTFQRNGDTQHSPPSKGKKGVLGDSGMEMEFLYASLIYEYAIIHSFKCY